MTTKEEREIFAKNSKDKMIKWCCDNHMLPNLCFVPTTIFPEAETKVDVDDLLCKLKNEEMVFENIKNLHKNMVLSGTDMFYLWAKLQDFEK